MVKMRVNVLPPVPIAQIFHRKDSLSYFEQHRAMFHKIKPTEARLTDFIEVQYKEPYNLGTKIRVSGSIRSKTN
jgi:hypothetical protein